MDVAAPPQVALLFIVTAGDGVAHEPAWRSWFEAAEGLVPASVASARTRHVPSLSRCARMLVTYTLPHKRAAGAQSRADAGQHTFTIAHVACCTLPSVHQILP